MKNSNDTIRNQTHDLLACSAVPQPTVPPRAPYLFIVTNKNRKKKKAVRIGGRGLVFEPVASEIQIQVQTNLSVT